MRSGSDPAVRSGGAGTHTEVCSHGVPGAGQGVGHRVDADPGVDPSHDVPLEPGN